MAPNIRRKKPDPALVREYFDYADGRLYWRTQDHKHARLIGMEAGNVLDTGRLKYWAVTFGGARIQRSHLVFAWHNGRWPLDHLQMDHINQDSMDDRIENLRESSAGANCRNRSSSVGLIAKSFTKNTNPTLIFNKVIPAEIFEQKCAEFEALILPWTESIENYILGTLPNGTDPVAEALEAVQSTEPYHDIIGSLQLQHERMP